MTTPATLMVLLQGQKITPFISSWSTTIMIESKDPLGGRLVIRSTDTCWKGWLQSDDKEDRVGMVGWVLTLFTLQTVQPATYLQM